MEYRKRGRGGGEGGGEEEGDFRDDVGEPPKFQVIPCWQKEF